MSFDNRDGKPPENNPDNPESGPGGLLKAIAGHFRQYSAYERGYKPPGPDEVATPEAEGALRSVLRRALAESDERALASAKPSAVENRRTRKPEDGQAGSLHVTRDEKTGLLILEIGHGKKSSSDPRYTHEASSLSYGVGPDESSSVIKGNRRWVTPDGTWENMSKERKDEMIPSDKELRDTTSLVERALRGEFDS